MPEGVDCFAELADGMPMLRQYKLPMKASPRSMDGGQLFKALEGGMVTMIVAHATDGARATADYRAALSPEWDAERRVATRCAAENSSDAFAAVVR